MDYPQFGEVVHGGIEPVVAVLPRPLPVHRRHHFLLLESAAIRGHPQNQVLGKLVEGAEEAAGDHWDLNQLLDQGLVVPVNLANYLPNHYIIIKEGNSLKEVINIII
jgi:hypothetical protein